MDGLLEVIGIKSENCINCHQCIAVCPVKVCSDGSGDVVKFDTALCIGCGRCIDACIKSHGGEVEKSARVAIDDAAQFVEDLNHQEIVALVAPSAQCNYKLPQLITGLRLLGLKAVYDVSLGAEITVACYHEAITSGRAKLPLIGSSCPAIVRYIELHHPALIGHLAPTGSPVYDMAVYVKSLHPHARLAFISPCLAKRREFQESKMVHYNVIYQSLNRIFQKQGIDLSQLEDGHFDNTVSAGMAANFSTPGGLKDCYLYNYPSTPPGAVHKIEGPLVYEKYLLDLENDIKTGQPGLPLIVDILSCEKGCNMGAGCINRQRSINNIETRMTTRAEKIRTNVSQQQQLTSFLQNALTKYNFDYHAYRDLSYRDKIKIPSAAEFKQIYTKMHKAEEKDFRNCAACGYNSCQNMAIAIFNGLNKVENCHLYQEKELRQEQEILNNMVDELEALNTQLQEEFMERKQQEQMLIQNSKLAAMGEMIGMIAHQWRQPLSSISTLAGNLKVLVDLDMFDSEQFVSLLDEINHHAQYLSHTINDFRHFFKPDNAQDTVMMEDVINSTLGIIGKSLEYKHVKLITDYSFSKPILTYPNELMQVYMNILKNASDAFVENETAEPEIIIRGYEKRDCQIVDIIDNGGGISEDIMDKIFDPYFSTKSPSVGTGLGLYMSKIIVEEHCRGTLYARNLNNGACFTIELPF